MSSRPNTLLLCEFTPLGNPEETFKRMLAWLGVTEADEVYLQVGVENRHYSLLFLRDEDYSDDMQIGAKEGDIIFHTFLTYGYGEKLDLDELHAIVSELRAWAEIQATDFNCSFAIYLSANFW